MVQITRHQGRDGDPDERFLIIFRDKAGELGDKHGHEEIVSDGRPEA